MLLDTLGIIIGFVAIILLLSIVVTAAVQTCSNGLKLRARALKGGISLAGLSSLAEEVAEALTKQLEQQAKQPAAPAVTPAPSPTPAPTTATPTAPVVLTKETIAAAKAVIQTCLSEADKKGTTWVDGQSILKSLAAVGANSITVVGTERKLGVAKRGMEDQYLRSIRWLTFITALLVAGIFQVSTPALLTRLQQDDEFRVRAAALGDSLASKPSAELKGFLEVPESKDKSNTLATSTQNADATPAPDPGKEAIGSVKRQLDSLDIKPFAEANFYRSPANWFGILITAIFLSFGAPFWYRVLKEFIGLRDALRGKVSATGAAGDTAASTGSKETKEP